MQESASKTLPKPVHFLFENSIFLVVGAVIAVIWANVDEQLHAHTYQWLVHLSLTDLFASGGHHHAEHGHSPFTLHFLINDILMAFFFAIAAKEVWEAMLPGGSLSNIKQAATPLVATVGGIVGPALVFLMGAALCGQWNDLSRGWAVPCATDIAFSYLVARLIFGKSHPAIAFLLLLAIADDAAGLLILAVCYPSGSLNLAWLLVTAVAIGIGLVMKRRGVSNFWWYLAVPGVLSWWSFYQAGIHPALGLVPIIPTLPHEHVDLGMFAPEEQRHKDALNLFASWWKYPVELILGMFALVNAGVVFASMGTGTYLVLLGLLVGKPIGICLLTWIALRFAKLEMPVGMNFRHLTTVGCIASLGFTVALFVATAAFQTPGVIQDSVKMGALLSFFAPVLAFVVAFALGIRPVVFANLGRGDSKPTSLANEPQPVR